MKEYKQKFFIKSLIYSEYTIIILIIALIFLSKGVFFLYQKYKNTRDDLYQISQEKYSLDEKKRQEEIKLNEIDSDRGLEEYVRRTYPVKKDNEEVVIIYTGASTTYEIQKEKTFWIMFKEWYNKFIVTLE